MPRLLIAETASSTWNYHLRLVEEGQEKFGGGAGPALCGAKLGWDTEIPLTVYGTKSHLPEKWCSKCQELAKAQKLLPTKKK